MNKSDETAKAGEALEAAGREYGKHSGPASTQTEREAFGRDLRTAALRYSRAYHAEAREFGLIPEYERVGWWSWARRDEGRLASRPRPEASEIDAAELEG